MLDFENKKIIKLSKGKETHIPKGLAEMLIPTEEILDVYNALRDYVIFTNKRIISCNVQGMTGQKKDFTSLPYSKIQVFSIETSGVFDIDSELDLYFSGIGLIQFQFTGASNIVNISRVISQHVL